MHSTPNMQTHLQKPSPREQLTAGGSCLATSQSHRYRSDLANEHNSPGAPAYGFTRSRGKINYCKYVVDMPTTIIPEEVVGGDSQVTRLLSAVYKY